jgi:hypothetical protein
METLTLNDGTVFDPAHAIEVNGILYVYLDNGITLAEAFELLADPEKTSVITGNAYGNITTYEGYTDLFCIRREDDGQVNAGLKKG